LKRKLKRDLQSEMSIGELDLPCMISVTAALSEPRLASRSKSGPGLLLEA
jgi:electron transfer flavoprotein alpha/beta subunit